MSHAEGADAAPGRLALVQQLANSFDVVRGRDDLRDEAAATRWLVDRCLLAPSGRVSRPELAVLHRLREAVRGLCLANSGCGPQVKDQSVLNEVVQLARLRPLLDAGDGATLAADSTGAVASCGILVGIVFEAMWAGLWPRLKACPGDACNYAFYDHTRNNSRMWCAMARCGARAKMRAYRARRQGR